MDMSDPNPATDAAATSTASVATGGMLSTITDTSLSLPQGYSPPAYGPSGDPLAGGVDFVRVWHAFRRRWLTATAAGLALAGTLAALSWLLLPKGFESVAWLRVRANQGTFTGGGAGDYEQYRKTQLQLIKSPFVLTAALRRPGISNLSMLAEEKDPVGWLTKNLQVTAPSEAEVVQVRLRGTDPREVTQIVNAVTQAYLTDVVSKEKTERLARRDMLDKKYKENMAEVRTRLETFNNLARSLGSRDSAEVSTQRSLLLDHLGTLRTALVQNQRDLAQIDTELTLLDAQARGDIPITESLPDNVLESTVMRHPQVAELTERLAMLEETMAFQAERSRRGYADPAVRRMLAQREELAKRIEVLVASLRPQVEAQAAAEATGGKGGVRSTLLLRMRRQMLAQQIEETSTEFDQVAKEVTALGNANADLEARRNEIAQLQAVTNQMGIQLNASEVDIAMPNRVELLEEARVPGDGEELFRFMLTVLAALAGLGAGAGLVVLFEYLRDRLSTPEQMPQRLGVRVLGTVPRIARSRRKSNVGEVAESVDGVRTIISQTGISQTGGSQAGREPPRVIIVTSAMEHEGKTTFAAQFAASLARAGHRTLLLDGDLRHPNVHLALELDLRSGFPELLRGEITADEAVQPTSIEGLFAVTGGACDYASITALSKPETGKVLKELRGAFDHVVIDAGPVLAFADVLLLGQLSDAAVMVTMRDVSRLPLVTKAVERLRSVGIRVIGSVVNGVTDTSPRQLYASPVPS
jgi:succinoglycan biosynthesis transport protein ExoP